MNAKQNKQKIMEYIQIDFVSFQGAVTKLPSSSLHALYQLCSALRVLSKILMSDYDLQTIITENQNMKHTTDERIRKSSKDFIHLALESSNDFHIQVVQAGPHLVRSAEICINQIEIQLNIIRTLSVLSEHDSCCNDIAAMSPRLAILLGPILIDSPNRKRKMNNNENATFLSNKLLGLVNRIGYILGNIMAKSDSARQCFYNNDAAMEYLFKALEYYTSDEMMFRRLKNDAINDDVRNVDDDTPNDHQIDTVIDVVIKFIRVVANLSVNAEVGYKLANFHQFGTIFLNILNMLNKYQMNFVCIQQQY